MTHKRSHNPDDGVRLRHFAGESDYPHLARVLSASELADQAKREVTTEAIARAFQQASGFDPYHDLVLVEVGAEVVGYTRGWWTEESTTSGIYQHNGFVIPQWRRKGIGQLMLSWIEQRLTGMAPDHPAEMTRYFQTNTTQYQAGKARLMECNGYQAVRCFYEMARPNLENIIVFPLPEGVEIRPVLPDHYRHIWQAANETSQNEWGYKPPTEEDYQEWLASPLFQPELWQVAWDTSTGEIAGHVLTYIHHEENRQFNRSRGYTEGIGVSQAWRRRGLARSLISLSLQAQKDAGMAESALVADVDNESGAASLYEKCGFQVVKKDTVYRKPLFCE